VGASTGANQILSLAFISSIIERVRDCSQAGLVIVMATQTQWRGEVEEEMLSRIGKAYVRIYNSPKPDLETDEIDCFGQRYPLVRQSPNEFKYTEILEVSRNGG
jgi:DNA sulfur modification protein DndD